MKHRVNSTGHRGSILLTATILMAIVSFSCMGLLSLTRSHFRKQYKREARMRAFYQAENAFLEAVQQVSEKKTGITGTFNLLVNPSSANLPYNLAAEVQACQIKIENDPMGVSGNYKITSWATIRNETRVIEGLVRKAPASRVFDYEYFLNNWGWWWGNSIRGYGHQRSNWDFDFRDNPYVNGEIYASGNVESNGNPLNPFSGSTPFRGMAGGDPLSYVHVGSPRVSMPNLRDFDYYQSIADGKITAGAATLVDKYHGSSANRRGIYLAGTTSAPIKIDGAVVIHGDCIIKGKITGQGTLYVGGNLYITNDLTYANGPDFSSTPGAMDDASQAAWVDQALSQDKDMIAFATRESILIGNVNDSSWVSNCYNNTSYGLRYLGDESRLGEDGIAKTPDDGASYLHEDGSTSAWYDADGDGSVDANYNYTSDIKMSSTRINQIDGYPTDWRGQAISFNSLASTGMKTIEGVFYTNHALAWKTNRGPETINGSIICRDEAIIFSDSLNFRYDPRVHSKFQVKHYAGDPNRIIDLGLPVTEQVRIINRQEIAAAMIPDH